MDEQKLKNRPPVWADNLLEWACNPYFIEEVQGDLHEAFHKRCAENGIGYAKLVFVTEVIRSLLSTATRRTFRTSKNVTPMFSNYFIIGYRQLIRHKLFSLVNIFGLAIGIAACLLIIQYVLFETSYDDFHKNGSRIYRLSDIVQRAGQEPTHQATNHHGTGPALKAEFPEVKDFARIVHQSIFMGDVMAWSYDDGKGNVKIFNEEHVYDADQSLLTMFTFPFLYGDPETALADPTSVILSESISRKYFGAENPIGKTMRMNGFQSFTVTGVFKDVPQNSHLQFDILCSWFLKNGWRGQWETADDFNWCEFYTYILLEENADPNALKSKLPEFVTKHIGARNKEMNYKEQFFMQPITDIHLKAPHMVKEQELHGSQQMIYFLLLIAGLILVIAWINYINLSTCKSIERAQEVGIRKVAGATKRQLIFQFLFESSTINFLGIALAIIMVALALPYFNQLTGKDMGEGYLDLHAITEPWFWLMLLLVFMLGSFGAGLYPAFILSSFRIVTVLKGKFFGSASGIVLRKVLVGSQFVISVALIAGTIIVFRQVSFMRNEELGYVKEQLLVVKSPSVADSTFDERLRSFKTELKRNVAIHSVAPTSEIPGKLISQVNNIRNITEGTESDFAAYHFYIDSEFAGTYGLDIKAGRNFFDTESVGQFKDKSKPAPIMLNERAVQLLGYKTPGEAVNKLIIFGRGAPDWKGEIVGVLENHHQRSLRDPYSPIIYFPVHDYSGQYYTINMSLNNTQATISFIRDRYEQAFPGNQFEYFFLDDYFNQQYAADQQFGKVFGLFSGLALVVAALGLFGLCTFMISQRTKEIAIRKVLGATIYSMVTLMSKDFVRLIVVANLIALPITYYLIDRWLKGFAFRIDIGWMMFVVPAAILLLISLSTVSFQTVKTGSINPVKTLRSE